MQQVQHWKSDYYTKHMFLSRQFSFLHSKWNSGCLWYSFSIHFSWTSLSSPSAANKCSKHVPMPLFFHEVEGAKQMKVMTRVHPWKTQHHVQNGFNLSSYCGSNIHTCTYTSTLNNNIWDALQRVGYLLRNWTLFSWFLAHWLEKVDTGCQAFPLTHYWSCPRRWWTFNLHCVNIHKGFTLRVNKFCAMSGVPRPFGGFLWYLTARAEHTFPYCNRASIHDV